MKAFPCCVSMIAVSMDENEEREQKLDRVDTHI